MEESPTSPAIPEPAARPRRVLYVSQTTEGGSAFSLYHLATGLPRNLYEPVVLFYRRQDPYIVNRLNEKGVQTITLSQDDETPEISPAAASARRRRRDIPAWLEARLGRPASRLYVTLKSWLELRRRYLPQVRPTLNAIRENRIDLLHVNDGLPSGKGAILAARKAGIPCVCHVRMFADLTGCDRFIGRSVDRFIYISRAISDACERDGIPSGKGCVIHNAVNLDEYLDLPRDGPVRREFGWSEDTPVVGIAGRLDWWKGHEYFLEAMAAVLRAVPAARGLIVGSFEKTPRGRVYGEKLLSMTESLGLKEKVVFTGFRSDVPRLLGAMDVVVLSSSLPEPFGRVVIEGMAAARPVVATAAGGVLDIVEDGKTGLLVPCAESAPLGEAILSLLLDPEAARRMGEAGRLRVKERFTVERHVEAVRGVYDALFPLEPETGVQRITP